MLFPIYNFEITRSPVLSEKASWTGKKPTNKTTKKDFSRFRADTGLEQALYGIWWHSDLLVLALRRIPVLDIWLRYTFWLYSTKKPIPRSRSFRCRVSSSPTSARSSAQGRHSGLAVRYWSEIQNKERQCVQEARLVLQALWPSRLSLWSILPFIKHTWSIGIKHSSKQVLFVV